MADRSREAELERRVHELEAEVLRLRRGHYATPDAPTVRVPEAFAHLFVAAQETVGEFFQTFLAEPDKGSLTIAGERYVLGEPRNLQLPCRRSIGGTSLPHQRSQLE